MRRIFLIALLTFLSAPATFAQEDVLAPPPVVTVERNVNLRRDPSTRRPRIKLLTPSTQLRVIDTERANGYIRVIAGKGDVGWAWAKNLSPLQAATSEGGLALAASSGPCVTTFDSCEAVGCGTPGSAQAIFNSAKRRQPAGVNARTLSFDDFKSLQNQAGGLVGQRNELTQEQRDLLANLTAAAGPVGEGKLVKIRGFIAEGLEPHANTGESVNCKFTQRVNNDFHISIVPAAGNDEFKGIVVEMIPQGRNAGWTLAKLKRIRDQRRRVLVIGGLFYDNIHVVNADSAHPLPGQPKRFSLWEIHPVTKFFVCTKTNNNCSAASTGATSGWKPLEDF
jgi:hypothetical protein